MKSLLVSVVVIVALAVVAALAVIYSGVVSVAATDRHWPLADWALRTARVRSIQKHAAGLAPPFELDDQERIIAGADHYADHCAVCHGAPGKGQSGIGRGLSPQPPELAKANFRYSPGELFWIVKNGIRMTGMPSWAGHGDTELWSIVAFLQKLPSLSPQEYERLVSATTDPKPHSHHESTGEHSH